MTKDEAIQEEIDKIDQAIENYLPTKTVLQTIKDGLEANKVISAMILSQSGEGMKDAHSMTKDFIDVPDWANRLKAAHMAAQLKDLYPAQRLKTEQTGELKITIVKEIKGDSSDTRDNP